MTTKEQYARETGHCPECHSTEVIWDEYDGTYTFTCPCGWRGFERFEPLPIDEDGEVAYERWTEGGEDR